MNIEEVKEFNNKLMNIGIFELKSEELRNELTKLNVLISEIFKIASHKYYNNYHLSKIIDDIPKETQSNHKGGKSNQLVKE